MSQSHQVDASAIHDVLIASESNANSKILQFGGSSIKVGEEEYTLFRDSEYVMTLLVSSVKQCLNFRSQFSIGSLPRSTSKWSDSVYPRFSPPCRSMPSAARLWSPS